MDIYVRTVAGVIISIVLLLALGQKGKELGAVLVLAACVMTAAVAMAFLKPVLSFFNKLQALIGLDRNLLSILLKATGTGLIGEIAAMICTDCGQASLGKVVQILTTSVILWISMPLFTQILNLVEEILVSV